jgi:hypothetical protein
VNIASPDQSDWPTGSLVHRQKAIAPTDAGEWQSVEITADGKQLTVQIDGRPVLDFTDPRPLGRGFIGLQFNQGPIEFRNVKLKPLGLTSIFNGEDLAGWTLHEQFRDKPNQSEVEVTEQGELRMINGPGALETEGQWKDLVMQLDVFVAGDELNSGVFFRSLPGEDWMGYESQIHNGRVSDESDEPNNCGTGGIWKRQDARKIVANDHEWFTKTINAVDKHIAVWVDGIQVTDFTDRRDPGANAREGLYDKPGTIQLQGHDPTTDLRFRDLRAGEVPAR